MSAALAHQGEAQRVAELMQIETGMIVADVGAGDGEWSEILAGLVGESGHVYANEIDNGELIKIRRRIRKSGLKNVTAIEGEPDETMLPDDCCDAILLRQVYHHISNRQAMRASLLRSLPAGRPRPQLHGADPHP